MRVASVIVCLLCAAAQLFGQAANGTITGTVTDPAGAVVAGAAIEVRNTQTGLVYRVASTATGNYTVTQLPTGTYDLTITVAGFKKYTHNNLQVPAASTIREDAQLQVGATNESVTVTAEASMLKTESGELSHNVTVDSLDNLPILGTGGSNSGTYGVRSVYNMTQTLPGVDYVVNNTLVVNGAPNNTEGVRLDGTTITNHFVNFSPQEFQPSADAVQEVAIQTSNYAPEFGTAGGGLFNFTMKSGTNGYHGSAYDYFVNEALNAGYPFTLDPAGQKYRPRNRRNDYGGTLGGPVVIPHVYDGHNKTFFFFNWEEFVESSGINFPLTLPSAAYRNGDFSAISPNGTCSLCGALGIPEGALPSKDPAGNAIFANTIYDPLTRNTAAGTALPFPGNIIPKSRIDPVSLRIQSLFPLPNSSALLNNGAGGDLSQRTSILPSLKIDQSIGSRSKLSFYWARNATDSQYSTPYGNADGLPAEITNARGTFFHSWTTALNYDFTVSPTVLLHLGGGYNQIAGFDDAPYLTFNAQQQIGVSGFEQNRNFPYISGMLAAFGSQHGLGGMQNVGTSNGTQGHSIPQEMTSFNANTTWVKGSHTFKFGVEGYLQGEVMRPFGANIWPTGPNATALPFTALNLAGQSIGFGYASFLLGDYNQLQQNAPADYHLGKQQWGFFAQDSFKVTRKLTVDYGLRYDYGTIQTEEGGRVGVLGNVPNPTVGGRIGGTIYGATCHCSFASSYPYAFGPRLGIAYQITPKTVLRAGFGVAYSFVPDFNSGPPLVGLNAPAGLNPYVPLAGGANLPQPVFPNFDPGVYPTLSYATNSAPPALDANAGRPPRQMQYSIGIQREITPNTVLEVSYVGNRGAYWTTAGANLGYLNQVSPATFAAYGLDPYHNAADDAFLAQLNTAPAVVARFGHPLLPYPGFHGSVLQALEPYPQFSTASSGGFPPLPYIMTNAPTGDTYYDALQTKLTKRLSKGLQAAGTFTWSKALVSTRQDFFDAGSSGKTYQTTDQPFLFNINLVYVVPDLLKNVNKIASVATRNWQFGAFLEYGSGFLLTPPSVTNGALNPLSQVNGVPSTGALGLAAPVSYMMRKPGVPLYLKDPNCGCINPYFDQVLNPAAWLNPPDGSYGGNALYGDFRGQRTPMESFNIARNFRLTERVTLQVRAEFVNIFNRTYLGYPNSTGNPLQAPSRNPAGQIFAGFGTINETLQPYSYALPSAPATVNGNCSTTSLCGLPRTGTLIARITF
ncbi:MAG TPA: TonB-dependent receptor [Bryobacteraceae bacterium]|nr:TonB-dependent receptor [Bryobacteraceae bacterium]